MTANTETIVRKVFDAINARDLDAVATHQHEDYVADFVVVGVYRGKPAVRAFFEELFAAFPDFELEIQRVIATDTSAVVQWMSRGTFAGKPFLGVVATGARVELRGVDCMQFEGDLVKHNTVYYDGAAFARAIGMLPAQRSVGERGLFTVFNAVTSVRRQLGRK